MGKELRLRRGRGCASGAERNGFAQYAHTVPYYTHKYIRLPVNTNTKITNKVDILIFF